MFNDYFKNLLYRIIYSHHYERPLYFSLIYYSLILLILSILPGILNNNLFAENLNLDNSKQAEIENKQNSTLDIVGFPIVLYTPETFLIFGGGAAVTIRNDNNYKFHPNSISVYLIYTLKNQIAFNTNSEFYFDNNRWKIKGIMGYQKYPDTFYGIGNKNTGADAEEFTTEDLMIQPWILRRIFKNFRMGIILDIKNSSVLKTESDGILRNSNVIGTNGGFASGFGPVLDWDTRDNAFYPSSGSWIQFYSIYYSNWFGSDFEYESYTIDARHFIDFSDEHILAIQILGTSLNGKVPFNELARLFNIRGVNSSRFRDLKMICTQIEYRYPIHNRFTGVVFSSFGDVMNSFSGYNLIDLKYSIGFGLRYALNVDEKINLRFDIGISKFGISPYFQLSEAF